MYKKEALLSLPNIQNKNLPPQDAQIAVKESSLISNPLKTIASKEPLSEIGKKASFKTGVNLTSPNPFDNTEDDYDFINNDTGFEVKVISFEEKKEQVKTQERIWQNQGIGSDVISFIDRAAQFKRDNLNDYKKIAEQAAVTARLNAVACAPGDGHGGLKTNSTSITGESSFSSLTTSKIGSNHEIGRHDHCSHGNDYGECPEGCKKAA